MLFIAPWVNKACKRLVHFTQSPPALPNAARSKLISWCLGPLVHPLAHRDQTEWNAVSDDVVKSHRLYTVTFEESLALLESVEPKAAILEQVSGFGMAAHDMDTSSPKDRQDKQDVLRNAHWVCTRTFFPAARWGSLDFNKGATPSSPFLVPSFLASSPCQLQMLRSAKDAVECAWTRD